MFIWWFSLFRKSCKSLSTIWLLCYVSSHGSTCDFIGLFNRFCSLEYQCLFTQLNDITTQMIYFFDVIFDLFVQCLFVLQDFISDSILKSFISCDSLTEKQHFIGFFLRWNCSDKLYTWSGAEKSPFYAWTAETWRFRGNQHIASHG